ncbi:MAG: Holliday junction branch migration DNA helicase RuvB [Planctomycetes bacterium]|nr:Holliday junction branch migration DNA helicase RuvB [Planctomycetota bacterium]
MPRQTVVTADDSNAPEQWDDQLRPRRMADVVGQREVMQRLEIVLNAAKKRGEPLSHILFDGPSGLGKTTLANVLAHELGTTPIILSGPALSAPKDLLPALTNAAEGSVLFIDEIHRLPPVVEEFLYPVMEDFRVDFILGEGVNARTINLRLKRFTVIGATTRSGMLTAPLRERFMIREHLDFYTVEELAEIIGRNAATLVTPITEPAALELARRSRGTPRVANNRLRWVRDYVTSEADGRITLEQARDALAMQGVDAEGLDAQDRRYLETLIRVFGGGPAGVDAVAHTMNTAIDTLRDEVEPYLLRRGFVVRTPRGRQVTEDAYRHLGQEPPATNDESGQKRLF